MHAGLFSFTCHTQTRHSYIPRSLCVGYPSAGRAIVEVGGFHLLLDGSNEPVEIGHASSDLKCGVNADFSSSWEKMARRPSTPIRAHISPLD